MIVLVKRIIAFVCNFVPKFDTNAYRVQNVPIRKTDTLMVRIMKFFKQIFEIYDLDRLSGVQI